MTNEYLIKITINAARKEINYKELTYYELHEKDSWDNEDYHSANLLIDEIIQMFGNSDKELCNQLKDIYNCQIFKAKQDFIDKNVDNKFQIYFDKDIECDEYYKRFTVFYITFKVIPDIITAIHESGRSLKFIEKPSRELCMIAVKQNGMALEYVEEQDQELCMVAVKQDGWSLQYVKDQNAWGEEFCSSLCLEAVKNFFWALEFVKNQTEEICIAAVEQSLMVLSIIKDQTLKVFMAAQKNNHEAIRYMRTQTEEICIAAVKKSGWNLQYVRKQTPELCLAAVQQNGMALKYVKEQTPELCLIAIKASNGWALECVKEQTPELCLAAVQQNGWNLRCVKEQTPELCLIAVQKNYEALQYVKEQTPELCLAAVQQNRKALKYVAPEFKYLFVKKLEPKLFINLPENIDKSEFIDPLTLEPLLENTIYAFLKSENIEDKYYLVGSLEFLNNSIQSKYKGSTINKVFVPFKNSLIKTQKLVWVKF